jgi:hypothetical protein
LKNLAQSLPALKTSRVIANPTVPWSPKFWFSGMMPKDLFVEGCLDDSEARRGLGTPLWGNNSGHRKFILAALRPAWVFFLFSVV